MSNVSVHEGATPERPDETLHLRAAMGGNEHGRWVRLYYERFPGRLAIHLKPDEAHKLASAIRALQAHQSNGDEAGPFYVGMARFNLSGQPEEGIALTYKGTLTGELRVFLTMEQGPQLATELENAAQRASATS